MSQINFNFFNKYKVKLSNHGYYEIYDLKAMQPFLDKETGWYGSGVKKALLGDGRWNGSVDFWSEADLKRAAKIILDRYRKANP